MTIKKLLEKYKKLAQQNYETVLVTEVIKDLSFIIWENKVKYIERKQKNV